MLLVRIGYRGGGRLNRDMSRLVSYLLPEVWKFPFKKMYGLIHIWIVGTPHETIVPLLNGS